MISGSGSAFQNINSPTPVIQVGAPGSWYLGTNQHHHIDDHKKKGSQGILEISDIIFTSKLCILSGFWLLSEIAQLIKLRDQVYLAFFVSFWICAETHTAPGAIVVEWNVKQPAGVNAGAGMWGSHIRLGGGTWTSFFVACQTEFFFPAAGTNLESAQCPSGGGGGTTNCFAAYLGLWLTSGSTAYLEVCGNIYWRIDWYSDIS